MPEIVVSGVGVTSAIGQGKHAFGQALIEGRHRFGVMTRPGRQFTRKAESDRDTAAPLTAFLGAEIEALALPASVPSPTLRTVSFSGRVAVATLHEAWHDAHLEAVDPCRIGLIVGGSNFQQRELANVQAGGSERFRFVRPTYGMSFMDSDLCGICTELFGIRAFAYTVGGASASGQVAVIQAAEAVLSGQVDACIALGALMDLSCWECQGLRALGAMGSDRYADAPAAASRPFDSSRDGFIFGECCGAVVIERAEAARGRGAVDPYARLAGWAMRMDGNRQPNPSLTGEMAVIDACLARAGVAPGQIDYVNPHGSGSVIGDATELEALGRSGLAGATLNTTKSIVGHGLTAAGTVELVATLLQMRLGRLHPSRNLDQPVETALSLVGDRSVPHTMEWALKLSMGFGGVNTAICLQRP